MPAPILPAERGVVDNWATVNMTPQLAETLSMLPERDRSILNYKIGLLRRMEKCLQGRVHGTGKAQMFFHFDVDRKAKEGVGATVEPLTSTLAQDDDAPLVECATQAHAGYHIALPDDAMGEDQFHWAGTVTIPLDQDVVNRLIRDGKLP